MAGPRYSFAVNFLPSNLVPSLLTKIRSAVTGTGARSLAFQV
jgi:hypothetical protein